MEYSVNPKLVILQFVLYCIAVLPFLNSLKYSKGNIRIKPNEKYKSLVIISIVLFSVFASFDGDWYHYIKVVRENYHLQNPYTHLEHIQIVIIKSLSFGNYLFWRFIVWGLSYYFIWLSLKRIGYDNLVTWTCVFVICAIQLSIGRVILGLALLFYGMICLLYPNSKNKSISYIKGILLIVLSLAFHKTMFIFVFASVIAFVKLKKWILGFSILLIPIVVKVVYYYITALLFAGDLSHSAEGYMKDETMQTGFGRLLYDVGYNGLIAIAYALFLYGYNKKKYYIDNGIRVLGQNVFFIYYIYLTIWGALTANHIGNNDISFRILWGVYFPMPIIISYMLKNKYKVKANAIVMVSLIFIGLYRLLYAYYLQSIGKGV